jgi:hypothetical protein
MYKYIVYTKFNVKDNIYYPCMCKEIKNSHIIEDCILLEQVYGIKDSAYAHFKVESLHIRKENVLYICEGEYVKDELQKKDDFSKIIRTKIEGDGYDY